MHLLPSGIAASASPSPQNLALSFHFWTPSLSDLIPSGPSPPLPLAPDRLTSARSSIARAACDRERETERIMGGESECLREALSETQLKGAVGRHVTSDTFWTDTESHSVQNRMYSAVLGGDTGSDALLARFLAQGWAFLSSLQVLSMVLGGAVGLSVVLG